MQKIRLYSLLTFIFILAMAGVRAELWHAHNEWNMQWENKFSQWMSSSKVHKKLFTSKDSPYYGIKADCADATYAFRAIFSLENSLPFKVDNPSGGRDAFNSLDNELDKFNHYGQANKKLVAFINYLGAQVGTEHLNHHDTLPVKISAVRPGMIFTYKIKRFTGKTIRHSYNIKKITLTGNFDVIYSTQAIAKTRSDMMYRQEYMFSNAPHDVWGFKRFKWPHLQNVSENRYPEDYAYSHEEFSLAKRLGASKFFRYVQKTLQTSEETPEGMILRSLKTLCTQANDRVMYVNQARDYLNQNGHSCMNYSDYDAYSTPARDKSLREAFSRLFAAHREIEDQNEVSSVNEDLWNAAIAIENGAYLSTPENLLSVCSINYRPGQTIDLAELHRRQEAGLLSSHPNDTIKLRWGETTRGRTRCKVWY